MRSMGDKAARSVLKQAQKIRNVVEKHERSSVFLAGLLMACAAWLNTMRRRLERQLSDDTKMGHVKLHGIVLITASVMWAPVAVLRWSFSSGNSSSESETRAVAEALDALSTGAQVASSASNSVLEAANLKLANTADAVMLHAGPGIVWFILVAALFGIVHHVLAEWATDFLQFGGERGSVSSSGDRLGGKSQPPSIVAVLTGQATSGVSPSGGGSSPGYQNGGNVSLPHHALGVGGGSTSAANSGAGGGAGAVKSLQGGNTSIASSPDAPLLRTFAMVCTFASAFFLAWLTGWGYQSSFLLWIGAGVFSLGIAGSAGLESNQFERVFGVLLRGSSSSSTSSQLLNLLFSSLSVCWGVVSGEGHRTYSAEAGGLVPGGSSSSALAAKAWFSGKDSGIGGIPDAAPPSVSFALAARKVLKHILDDSNSRKIFYFLCINFSFMFVEIIGGYFTNSLGLISDAGHMFFDNASLFIGLYASYMSRWRSDSVFTYGYSRYEVLAGFVNAVFLVFIGVSVVVEGVSRLWQPPDIHTEHLLPISIAGLGVNIIGLIFFHDVAHAHGHGGGGDEGGHSDCDGGHHGHSHGGGANENMMGVYLHVLADALGSIGVIISSLMIKYWGWKLADPIASIIISGLILASVIPLLNVTVGPLLQRVPEGSEGKLRAACATLAKSPDIARIENVHFWKLRGETTVGTLHVIARKEADEQRVLRRVQAQFKSLGVSQLTAQIERDDTVFMATTAQTTSNSMKIDSE
jgi:divalent metal cation (Fe/Co/Zn/Cd) transporter